jgi:nitroreductase
MFVQNVMLMARDCGLHTCPQASWPPYHAIVRDVLGLPESETLLCGMSIGCADPSGHANTYRTPRVPVGEFTRWFGFDADDSESHAS